MPGITGNTITGQAGVDVLPGETAVIQNSFNADVALGRVAGVRPFVKQMRDTITTQIDPPHFLIDINMVDRTNLTGNTTLYISSTSASDVGQVVFVDGVRIVNISGVDKLKEVFGFALTNGLSQVEVTELGTNDPIDFFRINIIANASSPFSSFQGNIYIAEIDTGGSPPLGVPANVNVQDVITLIANFTASPTSHNVSLTGAYTIPHILFGGETVLGMVVKFDFPFADDTYTVFIKNATYNGSGSLISEFVLISSQSGTKSGEQILINDLFSLIGGTEFKFYVRMGSNNQTISYATLGKIYYTPLP